MSQGITAYEFVKKVYYCQEKVILDFWPDDDKFKEVIMEANLVLEELQAMEDWHWLREQVELGTTDPLCHTIPEYQLPSIVYKPSTMHGDCVKLTRGYCDHNPINVPIVSQGRLRTRNQRSVDGIMVVQPERQLSCSIVGDMIVFNRELLPHEMHRTVTIDCQKRITPFHMCTSSCSKDSNDRCSKAYSTKYLTEVPDINYVIFKTAALHAEGSPVAQGRVAGLQDTAQKILSQMRENNYAITDPDYIEYERSYFVDVV